MCFLCRYAIAFWDGPQYNDSYTQKKERKSK